MNPRKLFVLLAVLGVLAVAVAAKQFAVSRRTAEATRPAPAAELFEAFRPDAAARIEIFRGAGDSKIVLSKSAGGWAVESRFGIRARKDRVEELVRRVAELKGDVRGENPEVLGDFSLTDAQAVHLRFEGAEGREIGHILLSPLRPGGTVNFVRRADQSRVFAVPQDLLSELGIYAKEDAPADDAFSDLRLAALDTAAVTRLEIEPERGGRIVLAKAAEGGAWAFEPPGAAIDAAKVNQYLASVAAVTAKSALDPAAAAGLEGKRPFLRLVHAQDGASVETTLTLGSAGAEKTRTVRVLPDNLAYEVVDAYLEPLRKDRAFFTQAD